MPLEMELMHAVFSSVFCDFGHAFPVIDTTGEAPLSGMIVSVQQVSEREGRLLVETLMLWA